MKNNFRKKYDDKHQNIVVGIIKLLNFRSESATSIWKKKKKQSSLKQFQIASLQAERQGDDLIQKSITWF